MGKIKDKYYLTTFDEQFFEKDEYGSHLPLSFAESLYRLEGFISGTSMFSYLNKKYDLSNSKEFWVYRWKWIKSEKSLWRE